MDDQGSSQVVSSYYNVERREMLHYIPKGAVRFVEIGCGTGAFGSLLRQNINNANVVGIEMHPASALIAKSRLDLVIEEPVEIGLGLLKNNDSDCIICNDVLEHLVDPWLVLNGLRKKLKKNGSIVASIPNVRYFPVFKDYILNGNWEYQNDGVLDRTHLRFFTKNSIKQLFEKAGYRLEKIEGIFSSELTWKMKIINFFAKDRFGDMRYERYACVASINECSTILPKI